MTKYIFGHVLNFTFPKLIFFSCFQILQKSAILQNTIIFFFHIEINFHFSSSF